MKKPSNYEINNKTSSMENNQNIDRNFCPLKLESLPEELQIHIFSFLPLEDLLTLTIVSKDFNTIISNSSKLLNQIEFLYSDDDEHNWSGTRKYPNVKIYCEYTSELGCLKFDEKSVKILTLCIGKIDSINLRSFLEKFEVLENLCISGSVCDSDGCKISPLPRNNLTRLSFLLSKKCKDIDPFMNLFSNWQVNELIVDTEVKFFKSQSFIKFIKSQNNLERLEILEADFQQLCDAKFKLKFLKLQINGDHFGEFLRNHQDSLIELDINEINDEIAEILNKFTKLERIIVCKGEISKNLKSPTVESLTLFHYDCDHSFPFVKELHLYFGNLTTLTDMKYLQKLTISGTQLGEISIPTVKSLKLMHISNIIRPFKFETSNLDELVIIDSEFPQKWIIDYLNRNETKLKKLKMFHCIITNKLASAIKRNHRKIENFEIEDCRKKSKKVKWNGSPCDFVDLKKLFVK